MIWTMGEEVVLLLVLAHLAGDFLFQSDAEVEAKRAGRIAAHGQHAAVHAALAYVCMGVWTEWWLAIVIGLSHGVIDLMKEAIVRQMGRAGEPPRGRRAFVFVTDQLLHLAVIVAAVIIAAEFLLIDPAAVPIWIEWFGAEAMTICLALIGLIVTTGLGAVVIGFGTEPYLEHLKAAARREAEMESDADVRRGFPKGGRIIGLLERALVFLFVITGNMTGVGFLVAAKSVFRFGEIREPTQRKEAEYIIIGTLMSFTWAIFAAWLTREAIRLF